MKKEIINLKIGDIVGVKIPYLKHKYKDYFIDIGICVNIHSNNIITIQDKFGNHSYMKTTELDILTKNN